jgi:hypothetical protein
MGPVLCEGCGINKSLNEELVIDVVIEVNTILMHSY